jgi:predicted ATP-grasp superfamily ATP-dependent carboligase
VVRRSLGPPSSWTDSIDKSRLFDVARRAGVPIADGDVAEREHDAAAIAAHLGYPVIVRPSRGSGGKGSARCDSEAELRSAIRLAPSPDGLDTGEPQRFVIQRFIDGRVVNRAALAWNGVEIAGFTRGRLETHPGPLGPASVVEFVGLPAVRDANLRLFAALDLHGLVGAQYMIEPDRGAALLIEIHRRMLPATHAGRLVGVDLAAALRACVDGVSWTGPTDLPGGTGRRIALFPQEWYRDPESGWLATLPSDAPWHDPRLFEAMLKIPYATNAVPVRELISPGP